MKTFFTGIFLTIALCGICAAQTTSPNNEPASPAQKPMPAPSTPSTAQPTTKIRLAAGSVIPVQLTKSIDAKKLKAGDEVDAQVTEDLKAKNGEIIVPKNTKVVGRVTEAQARSKEQKESQIAIAFDHAVMKNEGDVPMPMSIQAIISPSYLKAGDNGNNGQSAESASQPSSPSPGGMSPNNPGHSAAMEQPQPANPSSAGSDQPPSNSSAKTHQPITGSTQGVLGISNLELSTAASPTQGSVLSSEKNNVKLEGGTLMLLRVNQ